MKGSESIISPIQLSSSLPIKRPFYEKKSDAVGWQSSATNKCPHSTDWKAASDRAAANVHIELYNLETKYFAIAVAEITST